MCHYGLSEQLRVSKQSEKGKLWMSNTMAHLQTPSYPPRSSFSLKSKCLSCCLEPGAAVMPAHLQVEKKGLREFLVTVTKLSDLWPALHQEWLTEKMWERGREMPISSIVQPAHLTFLLIVCLNKGGWQRWCCSIDRMVMGVLKGPRGWWMGQLECSCKMTVCSGRGNKGSCTNTLAYFLTRQTCMNTHAHLSQ